MEDIANKFTNANYPDCVSWAHERFAMSMSEMTDAAYELADGNQQSYLNPMLESRLLSGEGRGYLYALGVEINEIDPEE